MVDTRSTATSTMDAEMPEPDLDLDKSWHGIHYLLTGICREIGEGAGAATLGGEEIGEDGGYGRARLLRPEAVRTVAAALDEFDRFLALHFPELRRFYRTAVAS